MGNLFEEIMRRQYMTDLETIKRLEKITNKGNNNEKSRKLHRGKRQAERISKRSQK